MAGFGVAFCVLGLLGMRIPPELSLRADAIIE
jgi:hypothetical protein